MSTSFQNQKNLRFVITLGNGTFGSSSSNTITLEGLRASVSIDKSGGMLMGTLKAEIFGVSQSSMNSCVTFPYQNLAAKTANPSVKMNTIQVFAIDGAQQTLVFTGNIINAWGNYQAMPDVFLSIQAQSTAIARLQPIAPTSYKGSIDVAVALQKLAGQMGLTFENNGVTGVQLSNLYLPNTAFEQAVDIAQAANIWMWIDNGTMAITPNNQARNTPIPLINPQTGMQSYPTFDGFGVNFSILFNPAVVFGGAIQVQSDIPQANGIWIASAIALRLQSQTLNGAWFMTIRGTKSGLTIKG